MTQIPNTDQDIRRHPDGSLDFDFYRTRAIALRRQAMQDSAMLKTTMRFMGDRHRVDDRLWFAVAYPLRRRSSRRPASAARRPIAVGADLATSQNVAMTVALSRSTAPVR